MCKPTVWMSPLNSCDYCGAAFGTAEGTAMYDAALPRFGPGWGNSCDTCFKVGGGRLGTGLGQRYALTTLEHGRAWVKTHG